MKKFFLYFVAFFFAICVNAQNVGSVKHEVQSGETLSSIARNYGISVKDLLKLNPNLNPDYIMAGQRINVPASAKTKTDTSAQTHTAAPVQATVQQTVAEKKDDVVKVVPQNRPKYKGTHEVQKKETIYSISKLYGVTEEALIAANPQLAGSKLKKNSIINIPYTEEENKQYEESLKRVEEEVKKPKVKKYSTIHAAVILPFALDNEQMTIESQKMANLYQGFLLAVDSLKGRGYNVDVYAYDESTTNISEILAKPMMQNMQMIVGPIRQDNINVVAKYANANSITHIVPLSSDMKVVDEYPNTYQVNVSYTEIYSQVFNRFKVMHGKDNIIFVSMNDKSDNLNYIAGFKKALDDEKIMYGRVSVTEFNTIKDMLKEDMRNVIIPSSGSVAAFNTLCTKLSSLRLADGVNIQLFGYPDWQTLSAKHEKNLAKYNCQFFTSFYSNPQSASIHNFNNKFVQNFKQAQYNSFPHYGELGFDIGAYFIRGLRDYGSALPEQIHNIAYHSLEFPFHFEKKNAWSGFQNKSLQIVTYNLDGRIFVR